METKNNKTLLLSRADIKLEAEKLLERRRIQGE